MFFVKRRTKDLINKCIDESYPLVFASFSGVNKFALKYLLYLLNGF